MKKGFTLIELLVVIAILGILISLVIGATKDIEQSDKSCFEIRQECMSECSVGYNECRK